MDLLKLDPKLLGFWIKCLRDTNAWSQEALAAACAIDTRTVQRVEGGSPCSLTTRRALARGLGYTNPDVFDTPDFIEAVHKILGDLSGTSPEAIERQYPDHKRLPVERQTSGTMLGNLTDRSSCLVPHFDEALQGKARETAAALFDYMVDMQDIRDDISFSDKVAYHQSMGELLSALEAEGGALYAGVRHANMVGRHWEDKTPWPVTAVYLTAVPADRQLTEILVERRMSW